MITIKDDKAIEKMSEAGRRLAMLFKELDTVVVSGKTTLEIDGFIDQFLVANGLVSKTKGYKGYKHASCISINDELVHGVPSNKKIVTSGDMVKVDICASWQGYCADMARIFFADTVSLQVQKLADVAQKALDAGIAQALPGNHLSDISARIQFEIEKCGFAVVRDFAGHGIGKNMHEDPEILNYGKPGKGPVLKPGMTFAIEPMITEKSYKVYVTNDGWTAKTVDGSLAGHVEDTILVTDDVPRILTRL
jgi:methionyl aminopeptidase